MQIASAAPLTRERPTPIEILAGVLLGATVVLHVVAMFPTYFVGQAPLAGQTDQAALYAVLAAAWALALAIGASGPERTQAAAALAVGVVVTELGFRLSDLGDAISFGSKTVGPGLWIMSAAWVVGAVAAVACVLGAAARHRTPSPTPSTPSYPGSLASDGDVPATDGAFASAPVGGLAEAAPTYPEAVEAQPPMADNPYTDLVGTPAGAAVPSPAWWAASHSGGTSFQPVSGHSPTLDSAAVPVADTGAVPVADTGAMPVVDTGTVPVVDTATVPLIIVGEPDETEAVPEAAWVPDGGAVGADVAAMEGATKEPELAVATKQKRQRPVRPPESPEETHERNLWTVLVLVLAVIVAGAFLPAWDRGTATSSVTGQHVVRNLGNAFSGPWQQVLGTVLVAVALVAVPVVAIRLRNKGVAAALAAGGILVLTSQLVAAVVQVNLPVPPADFGLSAAQVAQLGLVLNIKLTAWFVVDAIAAYLLFAAVMIRATLREVPPLAVYSPSAGPYIPGGGPEQWGGGWHPLATPWPQSPGEPQSGFPQPGVPQPGFQTPGLDAPWRQPPTYQ